MKYAEHLPNLENPSKPLCGEKRNPIVLDMLRDNDPYAWCKRCTKKACEDCGGSGFMNGKRYGIYCHCPWSDIALVRNGEI